MRTEEFKDFLETGNLQAGLELRLTGFDPEAGRIKVLSNSITKKQSSFDFEVPSGIRHNLLRVRAPRLGTLLHIQDIEILPSGKLKANEVNISLREAFSFSVEGYKKRQGSEHVFTGSIVDTDFERIDAEHDSPFKDPVTVILGGKIAMGLSESFKGSSSNIRARTMIYDLSSMTEIENGIFQQLSFR